MSIALRELVKELKRARERKGLSQRLFATSNRIPQGRLSKIENGLTNIRASNLLELGRSLDLELMLVPRQLVPVVKGMIRDLTESRPNGEGKPLYDLSDEKMDEDEGGYET
jgi:HTH-type transcriptional regulator / antitoxin HipB